MEQAEQKFWQNIAGIFDEKARQESVKTQAQKQPDLVNLKNTWPFVMLHASCLLVFGVGFSWIAFSVCLFMYFIRMFAITGFYHRYFSHRTFRTTRFFQFMMGIIGNASMQKGPLWWAAHHRDHHRYSDSPKDLHSPVQNGFLYSHIGWITVEDNLYTRYENVPDFCQYPELVFINRFDWIVPLLYLLMLYLLGQGLNLLYPESKTNGPQLIVWGGLISTVLLFHATCTINSLSHVFGSQRYQTGDSSRNNFWLALITLGEGWHNNHHHYPGSTRQGFYWWEIDITYYILKFLEKLGIVWGFHSIPQALRNQHAAKILKHPSQALPLEGVS